MRLKKLKKNPERSVVSDGALPEYSIANEGIKKDRLEYRGLPIL